ncbi:MAG: D-fructose-6-phosphate amidotransferase, partial [SAR116 cluster bacterium]
MIGDLDIKNIAEYKKYMGKVKPMIESYGGEYLIRGGEIDALETNLWEPTRIVL